MTLPDSHESSPEEAPPLGELSAKPTEGAAPPPALFARLSQPFIPATAEVISGAVGDFDALAVWPSPDGGAELARLPEGRPVRAPEVLFRKIEEAHVAAWTERFGGAPA